VYELKESYAPFLVSVSKPIFLQGTVGLGRYKITRVEFNAGFLKSLYLVDIDKNSQNRLQIYFYPTEEALKTAYALGEIDKALGLSDTNYQKINVSLWQNTRIKKSVNYNQLLTLFYNTKDPILSNPKVRQALNSALPERFDEGEKAYGPFRTNSSYFAKFREYNIYNKDVARTLLSGLETKNLMIVLSTTKAFEPVAKKIKNEWEKVGVKTEIKIVEDKPRNFQVLLFPFSPPLDPDQYTLWHSGQTNNVSNYANKRIDKLLEDGRKTTNISERAKIYYDFQKYLLADVPASFLYFPYVYEWERRSFWKEF
jgi:peptide/nickel transport system substrate-binding protein